MRQFVKSLLLGTAMFAGPAFAASSSSSSPDAFLTSKTKLSLWTTAGLKSTEVHVDTTDGVVTRRSRQGVGTGRARDGVDGQNLLEGFHRRCG